MPNKEKNHEIYRKVLSHQCTQPLATAEGAIVVKEAQGTIDFLDTIIAAQFVLLRSKINTAVELLQFRQDIRDKQQAKIAAIHLKEMELIVLLIANPSNQTIQENLKDCALELEYEILWLQLFEETPKTHNESDTYINEFENESNRTTNRKHS